MLVEPSPITLDQSTAHYANVEHSPVRLVQINALLAPPVHSMIWMAHGTVHFVYQGPSPIALVCLIARFAWQARTVTFLAYPIVSRATPADTAIVLDQQTVLCVSQVLIVHMMVPSAVQSVLPERFLLLLVCHNVCHATRDSCVG